MNAVASSWQLGSIKQHGYASKLVGRTAYASLLDAACAFLDRDPEDLLAHPPSVEDASRVIRELETIATSAFTSDNESTPAPQSHPPSDTGDRPHPTAARRPRYLTARHLRWIAQGERKAPEDLDDDAKWVLDLLKKALAAEALFAPPPPPVKPGPINGDQPITMEHLLQYFGDWDPLALAFGVSVSTAKGWGTYLPPKYVCDAEVKTDGFVRAPRP